MPSISLIVADAGVILHRIGIEQHQVRVVDGHYQAPILNADSRMYTMHTCEAVALCELPWHG